MLGDAIAAQPLAAAGLRRLATEQSGPRPAGVDGDRRIRAPGGERSAAIEAEMRTARPRRP